MARREASVSSEWVVLPGYVRRVGISPMPTIAAAPRRLMDVTSPSTLKMRQGICANDTALGQLTRVRILRGRGSFDFEN